MTIKAKLFAGIPGIPVDKTILKKMVPQADEMKATRNAMFIMFILFAIVFIFMLYSGGASDSFVYGLIVPIVQYTSGIGLLFFGITALLLHVYKQS